MDAEYIILSQRRVEYKQNTLNQTLLSYVASFLTPHYYEARQAL